MLIFEHVDQDLSQYLEKHTSGLSPECIQVCFGSVTKLCCPCYFVVVDKQWPFYGPVSGAGGCTGFRGLMRGMATHLEVTPSGKWLLAKLEDAMWAFSEQYVLQIHLCIVHHDTVPLGYADQLPHLECKTQLVTSHKIVSNAVPNDVVRWVWFES